MTYLLLVLSFVLTGWLVWSAWRRADRSRRYARIAASTIAVVSLLLTIFPPFLSTPTQPAAAILLTEGYAEDTLNRLLRKEGEQPLLFSYQLQKEGVTEIKNLESWRQQYPQVKNVQVLGHGLPEYALPFLDSVRVEPHLSPLPEGIVDLYWPRLLNLGEPLRVGGRYHSSGKTPTRLFLSLAGHSQDSLLISRLVPQDTTFLLGHTPKETGRWTYRVRIERGQEVKEELLPVEVQTAAPLKILILASFPTFEIKFLKNTLSGLHHSVAFRAAISKGKYQTEWLNMPEVGLGRISPDLLGQFDLLLADTQSLESLATVEMQALRQAVETEGMGLLAWPLSLPLNQKLGLLNGFTARKVDDKETRPVHVAIPNTKLASTPVSALTYSLTLSESISALVTADEGSRVIAFRNQGRGQVALSLLTDTYRWSLEGKHTDYETFWASVIKKMVKRPLLEQDWNVPLIPIVHQPLDLKLADFAANPMSIAQASVHSADSAQTTSIYFGQHPLLPWQFQATYWPDSTGWYSLRNGQALPFWFYVFSPQDWGTLQQVNRQEATRKWTSRQSGTSMRLQATMVKEEMPAIWFFLLFLFSSAYLWLEEKL